MLAYYLYVCCIWTQGKLHFKNTTIHRIVPDFVIQMGDITVGDGSGGQLMALMSAADNTPKDFAVVLYLVNIKL